MPKAFVSFTLTAGSSGRESSYQSGLEALTYACRRNPVLGPGPASVLPTHWSLHMLLPLPRGLLPPGHMVNSFQCHGSQPSQTY